jgi:hypothetical protein
METLQEGKHIRAVVMQPTGSQNMQLQSNSHNQKLFLLVFRQKSAISRNVSNESQPAFSKWPTSYEQFDSRLMLTWIIFKDRLRTAQ